MDASTRQRDFKALAILDLGAYHDDKCWLYDAKPARHKTVVCQSVRRHTPDGWSPLQLAPRPAGEAARERGGVCTGRRAAPAHVRGEGGQLEALGSAPAPTARRKVHIADMYFAEELRASLHDGTSHRRARPPAKSRQHACRDERACREDAGWDAPSEEPLRDAARTVACRGSARWRPADGTIGEGRWLLYTDAAHLLLDTVGSREGSDDFALRFT